MVNGDRVQGNHHEEKEIDLQGSNCSTNLIFLILPTLIADFVINARTLS